MSREITLIGAGLAGSLLAIYLARRGFKVTVYERRPDLRSSEISAGRSINLALANRGLAALSRVDLLPQVEPLLLPMAGRMLHPLSGELGFQRYGSRDEEVIYSVSRGLLNGVLMDAAEATGQVDIHFETALENYRPDSGILELRDLRKDRVSRIEVPTLIATDGGGSPVRRAMVEHGSVTASEDLLDHGYKELNMPPREDGSHAMDVNALHIWPRGGYMLIALPNLDGSFTVTLFLAMDGEAESFAALRTDAEVEVFFASRFPDTLELIPDLVAQYRRNPTGRMGTVRSYPWSIGSRALLLGDAAHAIVPFHGQGMNCAFEDCAALDDCLNTHEDDWEQVFRQFQALRKPNAAAIADMALENYIEMRDKVAQARFQLQKKIEFQLQARHPERFRARYAMVMFETLPYAEAQQRGRIQQEILDVLSEQVDTLDAVDMTYADKLVQDRCAVFATKQDSPARS